MTWDGSGFDFLYGSEHTCWAAWSALPCIMPPSETDITLCNGDLLPDWRKTSGRQ
jgi:hypothetical protein